MVEFDVGAWLRNLDFLIFLIFWGVTGPGFLSQVPTLGRFYAGLGQRGSWSLGFWILGMYGVY